MPSLDRRSLLAAAATGLAAGLVAVRAVAQTAAPAQPAGAPPAAGPFRLDPLPYGFDGNAPSIDAQTMELHHDRHHAAYVTNLNAALKDHGDLARRPLHEILANLSSVPDTIRTAVRNNGGGHANHTMFWPVMGGKGGEPTGDLKAAIDRDLGGFAKLKAEFNGAGARHFGSGWVFVTVTPEGKLAIATKPNQDTPLMDGGRALFGNDVWEHAYYLKYQNRRPEYLEAWWNVVNWPKVAERYAAAKAGTLTI